jgi:hypothetical protein
MTQHSGQSGTTARTGRDRFEEAFAEAEFVERLADLSR